jgi:hypothetical protein
MNCLFFFQVSREAESNNYMNEITWLPSNIRGIGFSKNSLESNDDLLAYTFYKSTNLFSQYMFTFYSLLNLSLGNDIAPTSYFQVFIYIYFIYILMNKI